MTTPTQGSQLHSNMETSWGCQLRLSGPANHGRNVQTKRDIDDIWVSIDPPIHPSIDLSIYLPIYLSIDLSKYIYIYLSIYLSIYLTN